MKKLSSSLPNMLLSLVGICVLVSTILAYLNSVTSEPIARAKTQAKVEAIARVTPKFDNNPYQEVFYLCPEGEQDSLPIYPARMGDRVVGYAIETYTNNGFNGHLAIMMGIDTEGTLVDFSVLENNETPGLGSKIMDWFHSPSTKGGVQDVRGISLQDKAPLSVRKDGGQVDAITAATISSRAFLDALNRGYKVYQQISTQTSRD